MMDRIRVFTCTLAVALAALAAGLLPATRAVAQSGDFTRGLELYQNHCTGCHESVVHVRERRTVDDPAALEAQVRRRARGIDLDWGNEEVRDVVRYLGQRYYGFELSGS